jgi:twitching motility protein PilT
MSAFLESLTGLARHWGASDLFLAEGQPARIKVNGTFHQHEQQVSAGDMEELCTACGVSAATVQDRDAAWYSADGVRFRVNLHRRMGKLGAVMRQIRTQVADMNALGLPSELLRSWLSRRAGLILVTGPTGCGKSTTVASCLDHLSNSRPGHIVTIEDPIEYLFADRAAFFTQREVGLDTPSYLTGLQKALRQAPDVIFLGEIRDADSAITCLQAAETGHLVISTLHSPNVTETLDRLANLVPAGDREVMLSLLSHQTIGVISQRLLPGADGTGVVLVYEHMEVNGAAREWMRAMNIPALAEHLRRGDDPGNCSLLQSLVAACSSGRIDYDTALANSGNTFEFNRALRGVS